MTRYGRSPWVDGFPKSRLPAYPRFRGEVDVDVAVIGGGLTGCATAYALAASGVKVILLEADRLGRGASGAASGWIGDEPGVDFVALERAMGLKSARRVFQAWRRASRDFVALLRRLDFKCALDQAGGLRLARTADEASSLSREHKARKAAGLDTPWISPRVAASEVGLSAGAFRTGGIAIDPYRATLGLAAAAAERGAQIFEQSPVLKTTFTRRTSAVHTASGLLHTRRIVVAIGAPVTLFKPLARHFWFHNRYLTLTEPIPARVRRTLGTTRTVVHDSAVPPHGIRWVGEDRLLVSGADGVAVPARLRDKVLVQRTGQLMYELSTIYPEISGIQPALGWDAGYIRTAEGLPYIGAHRNYPFHLFALGDSSHGITGSYLASRMMVRQHLGGADPLDGDFAFTR